MRFLALVGIATGSLTASACVTASDATPAAVGQSPRQVADSFLESFNALDSASFDRFFADDVTMFFPGGPFPTARVEGQAAVTAAFRSFFDMARERGATRLGIRPLDLQVQDYGEFAIVSFHLRGNGNVGRRSLVLRRDAGEWRIVHFHASSLEEEQ